LFGDRAAIRAERREADEPAEFTGGTSKVSARMAIGRGSWFFERQGPERC